MIHQENYFILQQRNVRLMERLLRFCENLAGLMGNQFVADVIFVLEIEIKGSLSHSCPIHNIGNGGVCNSFTGEQFECGI